MSKISFSFNFKSHELRSLILPIEVRKSNLALVAQTLTTQSVDLEPGIYYVTARLPAGQELFNRVTVVEDQADTVALAPEPEDESPHEWLEVDSYITGQSPASSSSVSSLEGLGTQKIVAKLRAFSGNVLLGETTARDDQAWLIPRSAQSQGVAKFDLFPGDVRFVQLLQPGISPLNVALPISPLTSPQIPIRIPASIGCQLILTLQPDGLLSVDILLQHPAADALLRYFQRGLLEQAATMSTSDALQAEQLLGEKQSHPIAAAAGTYALLRLGDLDRLHNWTENLKNWFTWLPDGTAIRGEHLARLGKHEEALAAFLELSSRGLPLFSDGLSYTVDRLRLYSTIAELEARSEAQTILKQLQRFVPFVDFRKPFLTFTGIDPSNPSEKSLEEDVEDFDGIDVAQHLG